jgi:hypothetical protein
MAVINFNSFFVPFLPLVISIIISFTGIRAHIHAHQQKQLHEAGHRFQHQAQAIHERGVIPPTTPNPTLALEPSFGSIVSIVTPSPGANPITITSQAEIITSYGLFYSICPLSASSIISAPFANASVTFTMPPAPPDCSTSFTPTVTPICNTALIGLATSVSITNCSQSVTFSTAYNYSVDVSPTPHVRIITTYFIAGWQELVDGAVPTLVGARECSADTASLTTTCVDSLESWAIVNVTAITTTESHVTIAESISGPSVIMVQTFRSDITATETFVNVDTILIASRLVDVETISRSPLTPGQTSTATNSDATSTVTITTTRLVEFVSGQSMLPGGTANTAIDVPSAVNTNGPKSSANDLFTDNTPLIQNGHISAPTSNPVSNPINVIEPGKSFVPVRSDFQPKPSAGIINTDDIINNLNSLGSSSLSNQG